jgi:poly-gamma-glutamate synthesis protein (capsule biosynthesis protein)
MKVKLMYSVCIIVVTAFVLSMCSTSHSVNNVNEKESTSAIPDINNNAANYNEAITINYIPDSIAEMTINLVGDLMCHLPQTKNAQTGSDTYDFKPSFEYIKPFLQQADLTIGNLETTFAGTNQPYAGYPAFNSPDAYCEALKDAGFDFLVTANNHSMDTREAGLLRTIEIIKKNNLGYAGTYFSKKDMDSIRIITINGIRLGILNFTYGTNGAYPSADNRYMLSLIDSAEVTHSILAAKQKGADVVLVFYHMGTENISEPTAAQKNAVKYAMDAGANLIIGAHPHVVGPTTKQYSKAINDSVFIAYSLGNFLSNQYWRYTDAGVILKICIQKNVTKNKTTFKKAEYTPTWVYRGDGAKKMHIVFPAHLVFDSLKTPLYLNSTHKKKMEEAFHDTKLIFEKYNPTIFLNTLQK